MSRLLSVSFWAQERERRRINFSTGKPRLANIVKWHPEREGTNGGKQVTPRLLPYIKGSTPYTLSTQEKADIRNLIFHLLLKLAYTYCVSLLTMHKFRYWDTYISYV